VTLRRFGGSTVRQFDKLTAGKLTAGRLTAGTLTAGKLRTGRRGYECLEK
jgi:hypothetical protein